MCFFFKQKTAYEMRISDWSSDVCSSDLYYTYPSTMARAMEAAAEAGKRFVVLDRPNPINGIDVEGPVLDAGRETFVGFHTIAVRHGMTIGEQIGSASCRERVWK